MTTSDNGNANEFQHAKKTVAMLRNDPNYFEKIEIMALFQPDLLDETIRLIYEYAESLKADSRTSAEIHREFTDTLRMQIDCLRAKCGVFGQHSYTESVFPSNKLSGVDETIGDVGHTYGHFAESLFYTHQSGHEIGHGFITGPRYFQSDTAKEDFENLLNKLLNEDTTSERQER